MSDQFLPGYTVYLLAIFLPGLGLGEILGIWHQDDSLIERTGVAFGLGLAADTLVFFLRTSGLSIISPSSGELDIGTVYLMIGAGALLVIAGLLMRRRFTFYVKPKRMDLAVVLVVLGLAAMIGAFFAKYPIFPEYESVDFSNHVAFSTGLISGPTPSLGSVVLYYGVEYQLAASILLVGGQALVTVRETMALLVILSPLLIYLASVRLFNNRVSAIVATVVYAFSGTLWFDSVFNTGLYANFFGLLASLFLVTIFIEVGANMRSKASWVVFLLVVFMAYLSHYSTLTVLAAIFGVGVLQYALHRKDGGEGRRYIFPAIVTLVPVAVLALADPGIVQYALRLATSGGGTITGGTTLSAYLGSVPVLQYLTIEVYDDVAFLVLLLLVAVYIYRNSRTRNAMLFLPVFWFFAVVFASPENVNAWRFAFIAILPLTLMAGQSIVLLFPKGVLAATTMRRPGKMSARSDRRKAILIAIVILGLLVMGSWGTTMLADSFTITQTNAQAQNEVYQAILWLGSNTPSGSSYLSVSDWRFTYTQQMIGRSSFYQFESTPQPAMTAAKSYGAGYIIVTDVVTAAVPPIPSLFPWNNFEPSANLTMIYSNPDVEVFQIA